MDQLTFSFDTNTASVAVAESPGVISPPDNSPTTRRAAAVAIRPDVAGLRKKLLAFICSRGVLGATDKEVQEALGLSGDTERPRRRELQLAGLVRDSGIVRLTSSGRASVVWVTTENDQGAQP